jgi:hypothetical protein
MIMVRKLVIFIYNKFKKYFEFTIEIIGIYLLWIILHYFAGILYHKFCTPSTLFGFLISPFIVLTPYCSGLRWLIFNGGNIITNMWLICGTWIASKLCKNILTK